MHNDQEEFILEDKEYVLKHAPYTIEQASIGMYALDRIKRLINEWYEEDGPMDIQK